MLLAQIDQVSFFRQGVAHKLIGGLRQERLAAVGAIAQAGAAVDGGAVVVSGAQVGLPRMQRETHPQGKTLFLRPPAARLLDIFRPGLGMEGALEVAGGRKGVSGARKDGKQAIPLAATLDQRAAMLRDQGFCQGVVAGQRSTHGLRVALPKAGAALYIRKAKCDRSGRQIHLNLQLQTTSPGVFALASAISCPVHESTDYTD